MAEFMMLMRGAGEQGDWDPYIEALVKTGTFRGGSALDNGRTFSKDGDRGGQAGSGVTGFMRFEATSIDEVRELLSGNPVFEAGGDVEILELVKT